MSALSPDLLEFVKLLVDNEVEFIVVGGVALAYHGVIRYTGDIDFFVRANGDNGRRVQRAIEQFGFASLGLTSSDFDNLDVIVQLGNEPNRIDIITSIDGVPFANAWSNRVSGELGGVSVYFLSKPDLLENKLASARDKDLLDVKELRKLRDT